MNQRSAKVENQTYVTWLADIDADMVDEVGGKNASLGEMIRNLRDVGVRVPDGYAVTASAYRRFLDENDLAERLAGRLDELRRGKRSLKKVGRSIRAMFRRADFPGSVAAAISKAYGDLATRSGRDDLDVAVRSSATAEDLPEASFAGQQETFLNVRGAGDVLDACKRCFASLFTDRAITYREEHGFDHLDVALSVGVQRMVRSDKAGSGVMFTIDTETGFPETILINAAWGLGEALVGGKVNPDQYTVFKGTLEDEAYTPIIHKELGAKERKMVYRSKGSKPTRSVRTTAEERAAFVLVDEEIVRLARWGVEIERHYGRPMDVEWAKDGESGDLYVVQARPETVQSRREAGSLKTYEVEVHGKRLVTGLAVGNAIAAGRVQVLDSPEEGEDFEDDAVLVTEMTDPDWLPIMQRASAIVTDRGGRTSHAAIVSRELGLPAVVGAEKATTKLKDGREVTVSCAESDEGFVYEGVAKYETHDVALDDIPETSTRVMLNLANPAAAFRWWRLASDGVGLARMEFIINEIIKIHPLALLHYDELEDSDARKRIRQLTSGYDDRSEYFVETLAYGIARIAAAHYPNPVIVRMSDFKTNEYAALIGGRQFEPEEENPMLGWRGARRYYTEGYAEGFELECRAIRRVREQMGLTNVIVMIPFCRTLEEADRTLEVMAENGLLRGQGGLEVYVMCEVPSNVILAEGFAARFDGFSIGSNDLTQLTLGVDRDSDLLAPIFDETDEAVRTVIARMIEAAHSERRKVGLCGQAPSDRPEFAEFLVECGIDAISVSPDSFVKVKRHVAAVEASSQYQ